MEKYSLCRHEGIKPIWDGKGLNRLSFCPECGQPIIKDLLAVIAYLKKPRYLRNGEIVEKKLSREQVINFICDHAKIIAYGEIKPRGRPRKKQFQYIEEEEDRFVYEMPEPKPKEQPLKWPLTWDIEKEVDRFFEVVVQKAKPGKGIPFWAKMIRAYQWREEGYKCLRGVLLQIIEILHELSILSATQFEEKPIEGGVEITIPLEKLDAELSRFPFPLHEMRDVTGVFIKVLQPLKKSELRAIYASLLVKHGFAAEKVMKALHIGSHHTIKKWTKWIDEILKKVRFYPKMAQPAKRDHREPFPSQLFEFFFIDFCRRYDIPCF
jgi:hypothetical protein